MRAIPPKRSNRTGTRAGLRGSWTAFTKSAGGQGESRATSVQQFNLKVNSADHFAAGKLSAFWKWSRRELELHSVAWCVLVVNLTSGNSLPHIMHVQQQHSYMFAGSDPSHKSWRLEA